MSGVSSVFAVPGPFAPYSGRSDSQLAEGVDHANDEAGDGGMRQLKIFFSAAESFDERVGGKWLFGTTVM